MPEALVALSHKVLGGSGCGCVAAWSRAAVDVLVALSHKVLGGICLQPQAERAEVGHLPADLRLDHLAR